MSSQVYVLGGQCRMVTRASLSLDQDGVASDAGPGHHRSADDGAEQPGQAGDCGTARPCPGLQLMSRVSAYPSSECWGQEDLAPAVSRGVIFLDARWGTGCPLDGRLP